MRKNRPSTILEQRHSLGGLALIELLVVMGILLLLAAITIFGLRTFQQDSTLYNHTQAIIHTLRLAQNKTLASEGASQYGVYFDDSTTPHRYILFQGTSFASRDPILDELFQLPNPLAISNISLGGAKEVVFDRISGSTSQSGQISLQIVADPSKTSTVYIEGSGAVGTIAPAIPSDAAREKDSRHVHIEYGRTINTATEKLVLTFAAATQEIILSQHIQGGQIYWEGEVTDGGQVQKLKIHTHRLNDISLGTQFSIHRDQRFNTKPLTIDIDAAADPDPGTLIRYDVNGQITPGTSSYVSATIPQ